MREDLILWLPLVEDYKDYSPLKKTMVRRSDAIGDESNGWGETYQAGKIGPAMRQTNDPYNWVYVENKLDFSTALTISVWFKYSTPREYGTTFNIAKIYLTDRTILNLWLYNASSKGGLDFGDTFLEPGVWHHLTWQLYRDPQNATKKHYKTYLNGELTLHNDTQTWTTPTDKTCILFTSWMYDFDFDFHVSDFRAYSRVLSDKEIKELANPLIAYYPMNHLPPRGFVIEDCKRLGVKRYPLVSCYGNYSDEFLGYKLPTLVTNNPLKTGCHSRSINFGDDTYFSSSSTNGGASFLKNISSKNMTFCCWYKTGGGGALFSLDTNVRSLWIDQNGSYSKMRLGYFKDSLQYTTVEFSGGASSSQFQHLALVFDKNDQCIIYINGERILTEENLNYPIGNLVIGFSPYGTSASNVMNNWEGEISDFRVYSKAMTQEEIKNIMNLNNVSANLTDQTWSAAEFIEQDGADTSICPSLKTMTSNEFVMTRDADASQAGCLIDVVEKATGWHDMYEI